MLLTLYATVLKENRKRCGATQQWLAKHLNVSRAALASYENGRRTIPNSLFTEATKVLKTNYPDKMQRFL